MFFSYAIICAKRRWSPNKAPRWSSRCSLINYTHVQLRFYTISDLFFKTTFLGILWVLPCPAPNHLASFNLVKCGTLQSCSRGRVSVGAVGAAEPTEFEEDRFCTHLLIHVQKCPLPSTFWSSLDNRHQQYWNPNEGSVLAYKYLGYWPPSKFKTAS